MHIIFTKDKEVKLKSIKIDKAAAKELKKQEKQRARRVCEGTNFISVFIIWKEMITEMVFFC